MKLALGDSEVMLHILQFPERFLRLEHDIRLFSNPDGSRKFMAPIRFYNSNFYWVSFSGTSGNGIVSPLIETIIAK